VLAAVLVLAGLFAGNAVREARLVEVPHACDWFIFLRQAQLFQQAGPIGGLDTAIRDSNTRYLVAKAASLHLANPNWKVSAGPYCHVYHEATDRLSIVSPPGTGLLLSLFPAGRQARLVFTTCSIAVLLSAVAAAISARRWTAVVAATALGALCLTGLSKFSADWSIPGSAVLLMLAAYSTVRTLEAPRATSAVAWAALLGLALGCAVNFRIANILMVGGVAAAYGLLLLRGAWGPAIRLSAASALAFLAGVSPTLAANALNSGNILASTYGPDNTEALRLDAKTFLDGFQFYFVQHQTDAGLILAPALAALAALIYAGRSKLDNFALMGLAAALNIVINTTFFCFYQIHQGYYPLPAAVFVSSLVAFAYIRSQNAEALAAPPAPAVAPGVRLACALGCLVAVAAPLALLPMPLSPNYARPQIAVTLPPRSIVWSGVSAGYFHIYLGRQAAVLWNLDPDSQDRLIAAVARDGVPQYLVADVDAQDTLARLRRTATLRPAGTAFGRDVYQIILSPPPVAAP